MIIVLLHFMLIYVGFWLQVGGSQGGPWTPLEAHLLTFGGLDWLWGLTLGGLDWLLGLRWPKDHPKRAPRTHFSAQHGPQTPSKRPNLAQLGSNKALTWLHLGPNLTPKAAITATTEMCILRSPEHA